MLTFHNYSIRQKLMAMSLWAASGALVLACGAFMLNDYIAYRGILVTNISTLGEIISLNAASSVVFNDSGSATKTLASLKGRPGIRAAGIYTPNGQTFAA